MRQRQVTYTAEAAADLDWIYDTIAKASSPVTASRYEQRIRDVCDRLEYGAERGTLRADLRPGLRVIGLSSALRLPL